MLGDGKLQINDTKLKDILNANSIRCFRHKDDSSNHHKHWHNYYEIELVMDGEVTYIINNNEYKGKAGDVFIMRLNDFHEFRVSNLVDCLHIVIPVSVLPQNVEKCLLSVEGDILVHLKDNDLKKAEIIYDLLDELNEEFGDYEQAQKRHLVSSLIIFILSKKKENVFEKFSDVNIRLKEITSYIKLNIKEDLTIGKIAQEFYINSKYLEIFFKKNTGVTIVEYIRNLRLEIAMYLVMNSNKNNGEICEEVGFGAVSTFLRLFKNKYGDTPNGIRKRKNENI